MIIEAIAVLAMYSEWYMRSSNFMGDYASHVMSAIAIVVVCGVWPAMLMILNADVDGVVHPHGDQVARCALYRSLASVCVAVQ